MLRSSSPLGGMSVEYLEAMYAAYRDDRESIESSWRAAFDLATELTDWPAATNSGTDGVAVAILALRSRGHLSAMTNPLSRTPQDGEELLPPELLALGSLSVHDRQSLFERLKALYSGNLAIETAHIDDPVVRNWLIARMEEPACGLGAEEILALLDLLSKTEAFEDFLATKAPTRKRFGIEGAESFIPLISRILELAAAAGVTNVVIGAMHRGRLNLMANVLGEPLPWLMARFFGAHPFPANADRTGDVTIHLGCERVVHTTSGPVSVSLLPNPSHLEAVNAVALGRARALQDLSQSPASQVLPLILHTDASVIAQGVVAECLQLSGVAGFTTAGAVHIIVNNQIGFTTEPSDARTSRYCTGAWKAIDSAILHVNGDDPESVLRSADIAVEFRQAFSKDAVIDLVCYRRNGHNEIDEPRFTQPLLYRSIDARPTLRSSFGVRLIEAGDVEPDRAARVVDELRASLESAFERAQQSESLGDHLNSSAHAAAAAQVPEVTGVPEARLRLLLERLSAIPNDIKVNPKVERIVRHRLGSADTGLSWPNAEALAFATLLSEGVPVRLTGQDCVRGAFSQRHLALVDVETGRSYVALDNLAQGQARFHAANSPLSEYAVLAFEYGYSLESVNGLAVWEAQFGDFANGAQIVIDQFIASGEEKWQQRSGLVILLPHGLEGQGPEHSSARIERLLQMGAGDNIRIAHPSTSANYFHLLRRQALAVERKPLFIASAKVLLRLKAAASPLCDLGPSENFRPIIVDEPSGSVSRILLCSGKIAYDLLNERKLRQGDDTAIVRIEMLYPLPWGPLREVFRRWPRAHVSWVQEEPANMGAWRYLEHQIRQLAASFGMPVLDLNCISRPECASPAGSFHSAHAAHQEKLVQQAFQR